MWYYIAASILIILIVILCIAIVKELSKQRDSSSSPENKDKPASGLPPEPDTEPAEPPHSDTAAIIILFLLSILVVGVLGGLIGWYAKPISRSYDSSLLDAEYDKGYDAGYEKGYNEGYELGTLDGYNIGYDDSLDQSNNASNYATTAPSTTTPNYRLFDWNFSSTSSSRPANGTIFETSLYEGLAPFEVNAPIDFDCYVYLHCVDVYYGSNRDISFYVRKGMSFELLVPLGTYELYYATGDGWVSSDARDKMVFGNDTTWNVSNDIFYFTDDDNSYNGYTVTLYSVYNGNMDTDVIAASDLPF